MNEAEIKTQVEKSTSQKRGELLYNPKDGDEAEDMIRRMFCPERGIYRVYQFSNSTCTHRRNRDCPHRAQATRTCTTRTAVAVDPASRGAGPAGAVPEAQTIRWEGSRPEDPVVAARREGNHQAQEDRSQRAGVHRSQGRAEGPEEGSRRALVHHPAEGSRRVLVDRLAEGSCRVLVDRPVEGTAQGAGRPGVGSLEGQEAHAYLRAWGQGGDRGQEARA